MDASDVVGGTLTGLFTIGADGRAVIPVTLAADASTEGAEVLTLTVAGKSANVTVNDTSLSQAAIVSQAYGLTATSPFVSEGNTGLKTITFELTLSRAAQEAVTVQVLTLAGTALPDEDYVPLATNVTFAVGQRVATVSVNVVGDATFEANETFSLRVTGNQLDASVIATGTITNDDLNPEQAQLDAYAAAFLVTATAAALANTAVAAAQEDTADTTAAATLTSLATAQAYAAAAAAATITAATAQTAAANQLAAAQAQLAAATATSGTSDNEQSQTAVLAAQVNVTAAAAAVTAASTAVPLAAAAVVDYTALTVDMNNSSTPQVLVGSLEDDVFTAQANEINGDQINGRGGNDTLLISGANNGAVTLTSVEAIKVVGVSATLDITGSTGVANLNAEGAATASVTGAANLLNLVLASPTNNVVNQTIAVTYSAPVVAGTSDVQTISLNNVNATVNIAGVEALSITATGASNTLAGSVGTAATAITVTGTGSVNLSSVDNVATVINAETLGGGVTVTAGVASSIMGGQGADNITGSSANDTINGGAGNDVIVASAGDVVIFGGDGNDNINASFGNNVIFGGAGDDTITLGTGFDAVDAGSGNDTIVAGNNLDGLDVVNGGSGFDTLRITGVSNDVFLQSVSGIEQFEFMSELNTSNYKMLLAPSTGVTHFLSRGAFNDQFDATAGGFTTGLTFNMGTGDESLKGGAGNDVFVFANGGLTLQDSIDGGAGLNSIHLDNSEAGIGAAALNLNNVSNVFLINVGSVFGLSASSAENVVLTISGTETIVQTITIDASSMQDGKDALTLTATAVNANTDFIVIGSSAGDSITSGGGDDTIHGGAGDDVIHAGAGANYVDGGAGDDTITVGAASTVDGGSGRDHITGSSGADILRGGTGSDIIFGNGGNDTLTGGADSDIFIVNSNTPSDTVTITDFNTTQDRIVIKTITAGGTNTVSFVGTVNSFAAAQGSILEGGVNQAVFQSDVNTLWIDTNNDGTLNANDTRIILEGVTNLTAANVSSVIDSSLPSLSNTLLSIDNAKTLYNALPNAVYIVKDSAVNVSNALTVGGGTPTATDLTARALTASTLDKALQVRFDTNPTPQQLLAIAAVTNTELIYSGISAATPADLLLLAGTRFADPIMAVTVTGTVSLAEAAAIDAAWGTLTLTAVTDTAAAFASANGTETELSSTYLVPNVNVTVTGTSTIAQLATINAGNGSGTLTYTSITDAASTLVTNAGSHVSGSVAVTVTGSASLSQLATIDGFTTGTVTHTSVTDLADNFANDAGTLTSNGSAYVNSGTSVTVTDAATLDQLFALDAKNVSGTLTYTHVIGTAANYASTAGVLTANAATYVTPGKNVQITDAATLAQLVIVDNANGDEVITYTGVTDTAANLASSAGVLTSAAQTYVKGIQTVAVVASNINIAQINAIDAATTGLITFGTVEDTAANLSSIGGLANLDGAGTVTDENHNVIITDAATALQFIAIQAANGTGNVSVNSILASTSADIVNLATGVVGDQTVVYTSGLQAATAVFSNVSDSTQLMTNDTFTLADVDVLTLDGNDKINLSAFNLSGQALVTDLTVNGTTIRDGSWLLVNGTFTTSTFTTTSVSPTHKLLLWDGNLSGGVGAVNMQGVVIVGTTFDSGDLILLA